MINAECFSALTRNVGKLREMKKAHEDMSTDITILKLENAELRRKLLIRKISWKVTWICVSSLFVFSADQLAEAKKGLEESGSTQNLRKENIELFKENERLKGELEASQKLLSDTRKASKEQADRDAESIKLLQDTLEARLAEIKAVDDELLSKTLYFHLFFDLLEV